MTQTDNACSFTDVRFTSATHIGARNDTEEVMFPEAEQGEVPLIVFSRENQYVLLTPDSREAALKLLSAARKTLSQVDGDTNSDPSLLSIAASERVNFLSPATLIAASETADKSIGVHLNLGRIEESVEQILIPATPENVEALEDVLALLRSAVNQ
jgi:hypothetical protein